ncbi:MAG: prepilin peptidase [Verrucomicrobiota bacterium]
MMNIVLLQWIAPIAIGLCIGSFLNVCIYRIPLSRSVVFPASRCAPCGRKLSWFQNIPVLSWAMLKGRCSCGLTRLSFRYPLVEILTALLITAVWQLYSPPLSLLYILVICGLLVATFVDIDLYIIPDLISLGGIVIGLIASASLPSLHGQASWTGGLWYGFIGTLVGGGTLLSVALLGTIVFRKEAMGMGDVKLLAAIGAFLGWQSIFFIIAVSSLTGAVFGIVQMLGRQVRWGMPIPFGPFISLGALIYILGARQSVDEYFESIRPLFEAIQHYLF